MLVDHVCVDLNQHVRDNSGMDIQIAITELLASGLTQQQLARMLGCSQPAVSAYARGDRGSRISMVLGERIASLHRERVHASPS